MLGARTEEPPSNDTPAPQRAIPRWDTAAASLTQTASKLPLPAFTEGWEEGRD